MAIVDRFKLDNSFLSSEGGDPLNQIGTVPFVTTPAPPAIIGQTYWAGQFTDSNYLDAPATLETNLSGNSGLYIQFYVRLTSYSNLPVPIFWTSTGTSSWIQILNDGSVKVQVGGSIVATSAGVFSLNTNYMIAIFLSASATKLWVNVENDFSQTPKASAGSIANITTIANIIIGKYLSVGGFYVQGYIADIIFADAQPTSIPTGIAPLVITATALGPKSVKLEWSDLIGFNYYVSYWNTLNNFSTANSFGFIGDGVEENIIYDLSPGTSLFFWVKRYTSDFSSDGESNSVNVTTQTLLPPTTLTIDNITSSSFRVNWLGPTYGDRILLYINTVNDFSTANEGVWVDFGNQQAVQCGLLSDTTYYVWAVTSIDGFLSAESIFASATTLSSATKPNNPTDLIVTARSSTAVALAWTNGLNTTELNIMRAIISGSTAGAWQKININTVTGTTYIDNATNSNPDPVQGGIYYYAIKPLNGTLEGTWSNIVKVLFDDEATKLMDEIEDVLIAENIGGGATGWTIGKGFMPNSPDKVITIYETPGLSPDVVPDGSTDFKYDQPEFQIRVRGESLGYEEAREKIQEVFNALHANELQSSTIYCYSEQSGPMPMGLDDNDRPSLTWNFTTLRKREE